MAESLRDLVVSLSLNTDNFTRNIKSVNKQIQEAESYFKLASAGVQGFDSSTTGLSSKLEMLERISGFSTDDAKVKLLLMPTNEELAIARDTLRLTK